jgi:hypothetical protein
MLSMPLSRKKNPNVRLKVRRFGSIHQSASLTASEVGGI